MSEENDKSEMIKKACDMLLGYLAELVLHGSFVPGVHDVVLLGRCDAVDNVGMPAADPQKFIDEVRYVMFLRGIEVRNLSQEELMEKLSSTLKEYSIMKRAFSKIKEAIGDVETFMCNMR